ncbi:MAG: FAD-binding protein [Oscillospiraceae bacterium]|nr:FAD-binding protein [Oscillospiraceae bacterium]
MSKNLSRREFIKGAAAGSLGLALTGLAGMGSASAEEVSGIYNPGTYTAVVQGYSSLITVEVSFSETEIIECRIDASGETPYIGGVAAEEYAKLLVEQQSVDAVTSATASFTTPAIKAAVSNCIAQAKGTAAALVVSAETEDSEEWLGEAPNIAELDFAETRDTDLLIVGAGNGGMMAAATAADAGMDFIICEQNTVPANTRYWVGAVNTDAVKEMGIEVDKTRLMNELARYASYKCNLEVIRLWINHSAEVISYLESLGMMAIPQPAPESHVGGTGADYYIPTIWHIVTTPEELENGELPVMTGERNRHLERHIQEKGYEVQYSMSLVCLTQDESGKVTGAVFKNSEGDYVRINAKNVILATGGYPGNPKMLKALSPIALETITGAYYYEPNKGMGIRAGLWAGATKNTEPALMIFDRGVVPPGTKAGYVEDANGNLHFPSPDASFILGSQPFLKVNKKGKRFINESVPYDFAPHAASFQPDGVYACIVDSNANADVLAYDQYGCAQIGVYIAQAGGVIPTLESFMPNGLVCKADSIEELAEQLQIPANELTATVARYNELCEKGVDEDFGKEAYRMRPVVKAPFYGFFLGGALLTTMDGLRINEKCQVLDTNCDVIEGLYCVGDCSGSFFSGNYPEYLVGCTVGHTLTEGRYAVKAILGEEF